MMDLCGKLYGLKNFRHQELVTNVRTISSTTKEAHGINIWARDVKQGEVSHD
jgi:hypothetical protein